MKRYNGGTKAEGGYYFNLKTWAIEAIEEDVGVLEGSTEDRYLRVPGLLLLPLALVLSFLFVVFLPFIGLAMFAYVVAQKLFSLPASAAKSLMAAVAPAPQPGEAYFAGKPDEKTDEPTDPESEEPLDALKAELDAARQVETDAAASSKKSN